MIDSAAILFSTVLCLVVLYRAIRLDRVLPWFKLEPDPPKDEPGKRRPRP